MPFKKFQRLQEAEQATAAHSTAATTTTSTPLVLVIDDDLSVRQTLAILLPTQGYRVIVCEDGDDGLRQMNPAVATVILDVKMPGKNGFQVYEELQVRFPDVPVIFYSAYQNVMEAVEVRQQYKSFGYIDKSGEMDDLLRNLQRAVRYHSTMQSLAETEQRLGQLKQGTESVN